MAMCLHGAASAETLTGETTMRTVTQFRTRAEAEVAIERAVRAGRVNRGTAWSPSGETWTAHCEKDAVVIAGRPVTITFCI